MQLIILVVYEVTKRLRYDWSDTLHVYNVFNLVWTEIAACVGIDGCRESAVLEGAIRRRYQRAPTARLGLFSCIPCKKPICFAGPYSGRKISKKNV